MIDYFAIALTHGLIAMAAWRLVARDDLDREGAADQAPVKPWLKGRNALEDLNGLKDLNG